jgi:hypothetical protein
MTIVMPKTMLLASVLVLGATVHAADPLPGMPPVLDPKGVYAGRPKLDTVAVIDPIDTTDGHRLARIKVGQGPHGLCGYSQPGRYSLGHTGVLR